MIIELDERCLIPTREVVKRYGVTDRTLSAWVDRNAMGFPHPVVINRRKFWRRSELEAWEAAQATAASHKGANAAA